MEQGSRTWLYTPCQHCGVVIRVKMCFILSVLPMLGLVLEASFQLPRAGLDFKAQGKVLSCPPSQVQTLGFVQVLFHHLPNSRTQRECSLCGLRRGSSQIEGGTAQSGALTSPTTIRCLLVKRPEDSRRIRSFSRISGRF